MSIHTYIVAPGGRERNLSIVDMIVFGWASRLALSMLRQAGRQAGSWCMELVGVLIRGRKPSLFDWLLAAAPGSSEPSPLPQSRLHT